MGATMSIREGVHAGSCLILVSHTLCTLTSNGVRYETHDWGTIKDILDFDEFGHYREGYPRIELEYPNNNATELCVVCSSCAHEC